MWIAASARKHGIADDDIEHAAIYAIRQIPLDDERRLLIGPDTAGRLLELIVVQINPEDEPAIIHAMQLRPGFHRYL